MNITPILFWLLGELALSLDEGNDNFQMFWKVGEKYPPNNFGRSHSLSLYKGSLIKS